MMSLPNNGRSAIRLLIVAVVAAQLASFVARGAIDYQVTTTIISAEPTGNPLQSDTVNGDIATDGTLGVLGPSNILAWNLDLTDNLNAANDVDLTNANSAIITFTGSSLTATDIGPDALLFNYSGTGEFRIQENGSFFSGEHYFCLSTGSADCLAGETITPGDAFTDGVVAKTIGTKPLDQFES